MNNLALTEISQAAHCSSQSLHLAIGVFDGLHLGHQSVIRLTIDSAKRNKGYSGVLTFHPHPSFVLRRKDCVKMVMNPEQKLARMLNMGIDRIIQLKFTNNFARTHASQFLPQLKVQIPHLSAIYVGDNFRFGNKRSGDVDTLKQANTDLGVQVHSIKRIEHNDSYISSTNIRNALRAGDIERVNKMLGYKYFTVSTVMKGASRGHSFGFPTLNFKWGDELRPKYGVYTVYLKDKIQQKLFHCVANFGIRPTLTQDTHPILEVHSLTPIHCSIGDQVTIEWLSFLREERKFSSIDALKIQIEKDRAQALDFFRLDKQRH